MYLWGFKTLNEELGGSCEEKMHATINMNNSTACFDLIEVLHLSMQSRVKQMKAKHCNT